MQLSSSSSVRPTAAHVDVFLDGHCWEYSRCQSSGMSSIVIIFLVCPSFYHRWIIAKVVLSGLPAEQISRLRRVQDAPVGCVLNKRKLDHVTRLLMELHWLLVKSRCQYKIVVFAYHHFHQPLRTFALFSVLTKLRLHSVPRGRSCCTSPNAT